VTGKLREEEKLRIFFYRLGPTGWRKVTYLFSPISSTLSLLGP
jgi:hypothetical protein